MTTDILPSNPVAELGVIGCGLLDHDAAVEMVEKLSDADFTREDCQRARNLMAELISQDKRVGLVSFGMEWGKRFKDPMPLEILTAPDQVASAGALDYYAVQVRENSSRCKIIHTLDAAMRKARDITRPIDALVTETEAELAGINAVGPPASDSKNLFTNLADDLEARFNRQGKLSGLATGFSGLDRLTDGLQGGEQSVIAARPSMGKTAIGLNIVQRVCFDDKVPTLIITAEMSRTALMRRLMSSIMDIPMQTMRQGSFTEVEFRKISSFKGIMEKTPLWIEEAVSGIDVNRLAAVVRRACRKQGVKLVLIDYLQKIRPAKRHEKRTYEVGEVSETLKALAVQTGAAFLTLAQLNRESELQKGRPPRLSDLADSGQIERDADMVALIHRKRDDATGETKLIIAKQRDGELGVVDLKFNGTYCRFENDFSIPSPARPELN